MGKLMISTGPCSIVMLNYQRVDSLKYLTVISWGQLGPDELTIPFLPGTWVKAIISKGNYRRAVGEDEDNFHIYTA